MESSGAGKEKRMSQDLDRCRAIRVRLGENLFKKNIAIYQFCAFTAQNVRK